MGGCGLVWKRGQAHIGGMTLAGIYLSVSAALLNAGAFVYALWRLKQNEHDLGAIGIVLFCLLTVGVSAIAVKYP